MYSALTGTLIIISLGILTAHAMDAFRSGSLFRPKSRLPVPVGWRRERRVGRVPQL